jgi:hypothetical protein
MFEGEIFPRGGNVLKEKSSSRSKFPRREQSYSKEQIFREEQSSPRRKINVK